MHVIDNKCKLRTQAKLAHYIINNILTFYFLWLELERICILRLEALILTSRLARNMKRYKRRVSNLLGCFALSGCIT